MENQVNDELFKVITRIGDASCTTHASALVTDSHADEVLTAVVNELSEEEDFWKVPDVLTKIKNQTLRDSLISKLVTSEISEPWRLQVVKLASRQVREEIARSTLDQYVSGSMRSNSENVQSYESISGTKLQAADLRVLLAREVREKDINSVVCYARRLGLSCDDRSLKISSLLDACIDSGSYGEDDWEVLDFIDSSMIEKPFMRYLTEHIHTDIRDIVYILHLIKDMEFLRKVLMKTIPYLSKKSLVEDEFSLIDDLDRAITRLSSSDQVEVRNLFVHAMTALRIPYRKYEQVLGSLPKGDRTHHVHMIFRKLLSENECRDAAFVYPHFHVKISKKELLQVLQSRSGTFDQGQMLPLIRHVLG